MLKAVKGSSRVRDLSGKRLGKSNELPRKYCGGVGESRNPAPLSPLWG